MTCLIWVDYLQAAIEAWSILCTCRVSERFSGLGSLGLSERFSDFVATPSGSCVSASGPSSVFAADVRMSASLFALAVRVVRSVTRGVVVWAP